jgi:hypothetical protein
MKIVYKSFTFFFLGLLLLNISGCKYFSKKKAGPVDKTTSTAAVDLRNNMRKLWVDNISWTRQMILCYANNLPGSEKAMERLLKNQDDIAKAVAEYYPDAAQKLTDLLHERVNLISDYTKVSKGKKKRGLDDIEKKLKDNSDAIADYLSQTNPNWKSETMKPLFQDLLKNTMDESQARIKRNFDDDISAYDQVQQSALNTADSLSLGLIRQFPDKF